ncbi:hypothetical protein MAR_024128 [Mya arenaria]|uniref:Uncharacterized protein n=1 Tax=Mya arenaria TaxID=6604 RepID=A0ABY7DXV1_MYAAR|nr:hypothetical protein MAR_024128 [Mya arenaria]
MDTTVRQYAHHVQETVLLAKLSTGDLISQEAKYHLKCYRELYHKTRVTDSDVDQGQTESRVHGIVLSGLIAYIEESHRDVADVQIFKLSDLAQLYCEQILSNIPDLEAHKHGKEINLMFKVDSGRLVQKAKDFDDEAVILSRAANIVRQDVFDQDVDTFEGTFNEFCQDRCVPQSLKSLVGMILGGPNIKFQFGKFVEAQAIKNSSKVYHLKQYETPLPTYIGMLIHVQTRKR